MASSGIEFDDRGEYELKGLPGCWRLFTIKTYASWAIFPTLWLTANLTGNRSTVYPGGPTWDIYTYGAVNEP